jgi:hypothetical protein
MGKGMLLPPTHFQLNEHNPVLSPLVPERLRVTGSGLANACSAWPARRSFHQEHSETPHKGVGIIRPSYPCG